MALNSVKLNDISQFSSTDEAVLALVGKYAKSYTHEYQMSIIKNVCFVNTIADCVIEVPNHYAFTYTDGAGSHLVDDNTTKIIVTGVSSFFFHIKNT